MDAEAHSPAMLDATSLAVRLEIMELMEQAGAGHIGPAFSIVEILRVLYEDVLRIGARPADDLDRDRLILSKGHGCVALYVMLARHGLLPPEALAALGGLDAPLGGHPERRVEWGIEATTGALGHGLPIGVGCALAARMTGRDYRVIVVVGDGELNEGSNWEAAFHARKHGLDNLLVVVDHNRQQCNGPSSEVLAGFDLPRLWSAAGWDVRLANGHDRTEIKAQILAGLATAGPSVVICQTVKNFGAGAFADDPAWHYKANFSIEELSHVKEALRPSGEGPAR
jgi:transketolase